MKSLEDKRLAAFLLDSDAISKKDLKKAQEIAKKEHHSLDDVLLEAKLIVPEDLTKIEAYIFGIPFVDLSNEKVDIDILKIIPEPIARKHGIVAYKKDGKNLEVAMRDPEDLQTIDFIRKKARLKILPRLTTEKGIKHLLSQYQESLETEFTDLIQKDAAALKTVSEGDTDEPTGKDLQKRAEELPVIRIVDSVLRHAISQDASDIHIEPMDKEVIVRYRIDGILHDAMTLPLQVQLGIVARIKVLASLKLDEHRLPQDGRFTIESEDKMRVSFRVSILPVYNGEKVVLRLLRESTKSKTLDEIGLWGEALDKVERNIRKTVGMLLVTGPTGSGKTTTLYTILDILNTAQVNISTIEDPIEYRIPRINQTQVRPDIGLSFSNGLRSLVRQDPDILMVGEIRDSETAGLAINAALTGHLVLSTLHTNSAVGALPRLIDMGEEPFLIASTINVIIAQRLVRKLCLEVRKEYQLTKKELTLLGEEFDLDRILKIAEKEHFVEKGTSWENISFYRPGKSEDCPDGYKGRIGIFEVLEATETIRRLITMGSEAGQLQEQAVKEGMLTMSEDGLIKAIQGITSIEEILRVTRK